MVIIESNPYTKIGSLAYSLNHSYMQAQVDRDKIKLITDSWHGCRESLFYYWKFNTRNKGNKTHSLLTYNKVFSENESLKARTNAVHTFKKGVRRALKVVRLYEEHGKIEPEITVSFLPLTDYGKSGAIGALFTFSTEWSTNPVMFSMLTLFMRSWQYFSNRETYKNIEEFVNCFVADNRSSVLYFFCNRKYWATLIKNRALLLKEAELGKLPHYYGCQGFFSSTATKAQIFFKERFM